MRKKQLGKLGEDLALAYLLRRGYSLIDRNFSCSFGEIDLIMKDGKTLVFVEVKTRWSLSYGSGVEAVTRRKLRSIIKTSQVFKKFTKNLPKLERIDVVAVDAHIPQKMSVKAHLVNVTG